MPAPNGNVNGATHFLTAYLAGGRLPRGCAYVARLRNRLGKQLTQAVQDAHGEVGIVHAAAIQSACRHEVGALLLQRWMRKETELPLMERAALLERISKFTDLRDRAIAKLDIDKRDAEDAFDTVYRETASEARERALTHEPDTEATR